MEGKEKRGLVFHPWQGAAMVINLYAQMMVVWDRVQGYLSRAWAFVDNFPLWDSCDVRQRGSIWKGNDLARVRATFSSFLLSWVENYG